MSIERKGDWILVEGKFLQKEAPDYEGLGIDKPKVSLEKYQETAPFRFNINHLTAWNSAEIDGESCVVLRLLNADDYNLNVSFEEFDKFILEQIK